ncbi:hypothetical protein AVEN_219008-1 [Araneus ventricosus]|uniref:PiggyBac transposable element-derived protein domain-containing protein n=1 Tax=Araneus ventricosus TaxID=182803 RepID=A0A4Y2CBW7_ARAVE|nr:hypothetical protein AVEN_219008-1 [Araneus ventricosus]
MMRELWEEEKSDNEINDLDGDEEYVPTESNNSDHESEISSQHDSEFHESYSSDNECSETILQTSINSRQKSGYGSTSRKRRRKCSIPNIPPSVGEEEILEDGMVWNAVSPSGTIDRCAAQNVPKETKGTPLNAKRNICEDSVFSAWRLIFNNQMIRNIKECPEEKARLSK